MSEIPSTPDPSPEQVEAHKTNWRQRMKELGRNAFEMAEMEALGFWPPDEETARKLAGTKAELDAMREQLAPLRREKRELESEIAKVGNVPALLAEIRLKRIARVKAERAERKIRQAREREERAAKDKEWRQSTLPHLGREVSRGLKYEGGDVEKLISSRLAVVQTAQDIADEMQITTGVLAWLTYHRGATAIDHYNHFSIPKKSGGQRAISSPKTKLRAAQSWVLENVLQPLPVHEAAMAFRPGLNIADNARIHAPAGQNGGVLLRIDLKDFFPSITFRRVKWLFESFGYNEGVASIFALLCTEAPRVELTLDDKKHFVALTERFLPQGACTSPALTNLLCRNLDARLAGAAKNYGFVYTRYADDLVFSASDPKAKVLSLRDLVEKIVSEEKLVVNADKTAILRARGRQSVTGLVVNRHQSTLGSEAGTPRLSRDDLRRFRAFLHQYEKLGREAMTDKMGQDALSYASGYLSFIHMVSPERATQIQQAHPWLEIGKKRD